MARMLTEPRTFVKTRPVARPATPSNRAVSANRQVIAPSTPETVLGDRVEGAKPRTTVVRRSNRAVWREMLTVLVASFVVSLLCFYVSAYARVTAEGFAQSRLNRKIQDAEAQEQRLLVAISESKSAENIARRAEAMGLIPGQVTTVNLVTPTNPPADNAPARASDSTAQGAAAPSNVAPTAQGITH